MVRADDTARADIALTQERTYYRFATDSSIEDGELAPVTEDFEQTAGRLIEAASAHDSEAPLPDDIRVQIFTDNRLRNISVSEQSLARLTDALIGLAPEFAFLQGFKK